MQYQVREDDGTLWFEGNLDLNAVEDFRTVLAENLQRNAKLRLDLSAVAECDAGGLQLLYSARKQADIYRKQFVITAVSASIENVSAKLGLPLDELLAGGCGSV